MAYSLVQSKGASGNSGTSLTVSGLTATTSGNLLVALVSVALNPGIATFTPPANWTQIGATNHDNTFIGLSTAAYEYVDNPGGITSVTFTTSPAIPTNNGAWHLTILEFSGVATTSPSDGNATAQQGGTTTPSSGSITTTANGDLIIGWSELDEVSGGGDCTVTQPAGYTALTRLNDGSGWLSSFIGYTTQTSAGSISYAPTKSRSDTEGVFTILAFKAAGGGGGTVNGSGDLIANAALVESGAHLSNPSAPMQANAVLVETAHLVNASIPVAADSAMRQAAQMVATDAPLAANSGLRVAGQVVSASDTLASNAALVIAAQIINPQALVSSDSALVVTGHIQTPPPILEANSALVQSSAQLVAGALPLAAESALTSSAQIVLRSAPFVAESVLAAIGGIAGQALPAPVVVSLLSAPAVTARTLASAPTPTARSITVS